MLRMGSLIFKVVVGLGVLSLSDLEVKILHPSVRHSEGGSRVPEPEYQDRFTRRAAVHRRMDAACHAKVPRRMACGQGSVP